MLASRSTISHHMVVRHSSKKHSKKSIRERESLSYTATNQIAKALRIGHPKNWDCRLQPQSLVKYSTYDNLGLVQIGPATDYALNTLREQVSRRFPRYRVETLEPIVESAEAYDSFRDQYHSTRILVILEELVQTAEVELLLGVAPLDLYVPGMNFVFGEARCPGRVAVISTFRLRPQTRSNPELFGNRVAKESVHEIGHMLGLKHCPNPLCVMYFSERLADTDRKQEDFCAECDHSLKWLEVE